MGARLARRLWGYLLGFLEVVGLREEGGAGYEASLAALRLRYFRLRDLLAANNELLEIIADLEERLQGRGHVGVRSLKAKALAALTRAHRMVTALNALSDGRYPSLEQVLQRIQQRISASLSEAQAERGEPLVVPLSQLRLASAPWAGNKMAALGEAAAGLGLPVPDGFVVTTRAFRRLLDSIGGADGLRPGATEEIEDFSERAKRWIREAALPADLVKGIRDAHRAMAPPGQDPPRVSVRSSAVEEDAACSFAGQYLTRLNVTGDGLLEAYQDVLASLYEPQAIFYRRSMGVAEEDVELAVGFVAMVDAAASGVAFSQDPVGQREGKVVIHAAWGLGSSLVDGKVQPDVILVDREGDDPGVQVAAAAQRTRLVALPSGGTAVDEVPEAEAGRPCLTRDQALQLARWVLALEDRFGEPQDVEWALDAAGRLAILQTRPLTRVGAASQEDEGPAEGAELLLQGGATAMPGAACGPVVHASPSDPLEHIPEGAVLVVAHSSPRFVRAMKRCSGIVAEVGSVIGHMASLAREFGVPTVLGMEGAASLLPEGERVTLDANARRVYRGEVPSLLERRSAVPAQRPKGRPQRMLEEVARYIVPLNLTDPSDPYFSPLKASTLHDVARYVHEKSFQEMFGIAGLVGNVRAAAPILDVFLPMDLYLLDLGGGLSAPKGTRKVKRGQIASPLLAALVEGMLHPGIQRFGPKAMDAGGFLHVMFRHALTNAEENPALRDPCFAIFSDKYLNMAARVGYHFSAVDAYCTQSIDQNYVVFRFKGGAADQARRVRRVRAIARILGELGFVTDVRGDLVAARFIKQGREETMRAIEMLGRLLQFMRQMDAAMVSDAVSDEVAQAFLEERYDLGGKGAPPSKDA